jgi:hypothetical protein
MWLVATPLSSPAAKDQFTPVVARVLAPPQPVVAADGRRHLAYELLLTNRAYPPATATVQSVTAKARARVVESLSGQNLAAVMLRFGSTDSGTELKPGESAVVLMDLSLPPRAETPRRLSHKLSITLAPPSGVVATDYRTAPALVSRRKAVVVAPPLRGNGWIVGNGCCAEATSHRAAVLGVNGGLYAGERFAIDFIQIDSSGLLTDGAPELLSSYPYFGDPVLSATRGEVVGTADKFRESPPGELPPAAAASAGGNHVTVKLGRKRFAYYAHLQPGSVRVKVGDRVSVGQTLGLLGSTGNSNAPHLHFQLMNGPSPLASDGVPYRFKRFSVAGGLENFQELFEGQLAQVTPELRGVHRRRLPLNLQVIGFRGRGRG